MNADRKFRLESIKSVPDGSGRIMVMTFVAQGSEDPKAIVQMELREGHAVEVGKEYSIDEMFNIAPREWDEGGGYR